MHSIGCDPSWLTGELSGCLFLRMIKKKRGMHLGMIWQIRNQHATCGQTYHVFINSDAMKPPSTYWTGRSVMPASSWWKQRPCWGWYKLPKVCKQSFQGISRTCRVTLSLMYNYPQLSYLWPVFQQQSIFTIEQLSYRKSIWFLRRILKFAAFNLTLWCYLSWVWTKAT